MKRLLLLPIAALIVGATISAADDWKLPPGEPQFKRGPGAELAMGNCIICHSTDYVSMQPSLDLAGWTAIVVKMREKYGAPLPQDKVDAVAKYLTAAYGSTAAKK